MPEIQPIAANNVARAKWIKEKITKAILDIFPIITDKYTINLENLVIKEKSYSISEQKKAILEGRSLFESVYGDLAIVDKSTNKTVEKIKGFKIVDIPFLTNRLTMIIEGNDYSPINQLRLKSGIYARKRENEVIEAFFNLAHGKNFRMTMDPASGIFFLELDNTKIELYPILSAFGVPDSTIDSAWGTQLLNRNKEKTGSKRDTAITKLYSKVFSMGEADRFTNIGDKITRLTSYFSDTKLDPQVTLSTLGKEFDSVNMDALISTSEKILKILQQKEGVDDRDNLKYQTIHTIDDALAENITKTAPEIIRKIKYKIDVLSKDKEPSYAIPKNLFGPSLKKFVTTSSIAAPLPQINPLEILNSRFEITNLGPGGIKDLRMVRNETRQVNSSHIDIIDPIFTKENEKVGVTLSTTFNSFRDKKGNIYTNLTNVKNGKEEMLSVSEMDKKVIAFPDQDLSKKSAEVEVLYQGKVQKLPASKVEYQVTYPSDIFSIPTNLIPFLNSITGNRALMTAKHLTHSVPLKDREAPLVQVAYPTFHGTTEGRVASLILPKAKTDGIVKKITEDEIIIQDSKGNIHKESYENNFPLNQKTFLHTDLNVKKGDSVKKNQLLGDSIYTKDGTLALGKNLNVAYLSYKGLNINDGVVISDSAAKKLTSLHMAKVFYEIDDTHFVGKDTFLSKFPNKFTITQLSNIESNGIVKNHSVLNEGDPIILGIEKTELSAEQSLLGKFHKKLYKPYRDDSILWNHPFKGEVSDVYVSNKRIVVLIKSEQAAQVGDKISQRSANKAVITAVINDNEMIQDATGKPLDILFSPAGITSRQNPSQILEASVAKVAAKTGQPIVIDNFNIKDNLRFAKDLLKKHGVQDKETVYDPVNNREIKNIMVGPQYILKQDKQAETGFSARNFGSYDSNMLPTKGGAEGSKTMGMLEINSLLSHNARNILREVSTLKGTKNTDFWNSYMQGMPLPAPKVPFTYDKLLGMMTASGVRVRKDGNNLVASPLTDKEILSMSRGEIQTPYTVRAKDLRPESKGLFDINLTGGITGTGWSHIKLAEPIINPIMKNNTQVLLGLTKNELDEKLKVEGAASIKKELSKIDVDARIDELHKKIPSLKYGELDKAIKELKYLKAFKTTGIAPKDALILHNVPVLPPIMRPIIKLKGSNDLQLSDANRLYADIIHNNNALNSMKKTLLPEDLAGMRNTLQKSVEALVGTSDSPNVKLQKQGIKGFLTTMSGTIPKEGFFQSKALSKPQDLVARGVIVPEPTLDIDQVSLPEDMTWELFMPMIVQRLVKKGYPVVQAQEMVKNRDTLAKNEMLLEIKERPVLINRAPSLHKHSIVGAYVVPSQKKTIGVSPFVEKGSSSDYDGDSLLARVFSRMPIEKNGNIVEEWKILDIENFPRIESSKIVKDNGNEIYDVPENTYVMAYNKEKHCIEEAKVTKFSIHKNLEAFEVKTNRGRKGIYSKDKSIFAINPETLLPEETPTINSINRLIPRQFNYLQNNISKINLKDFYSPRHNDIFKNDILLDFDFGWLLGIFIGEGWGNIHEGRKTANLASSEEPIRNKAIEEVARFSSSRYHIHSQRNEDFNNGKYLSVKLIFRGTDFGEVIQNMIGHTAFKKHLPDFVFQSPEEFRWGLLSGLVDGDGSFCISNSKKKPQYLCTYHTSSDILADEILLLCSTLGVEARITPYLSTWKQTPMSLINISAANLWQKNKMKLAHPTKSMNYTSMLETTFSEDSGSGAYMNIIPANKSFLQELYKKLISCKEDDPLIRKRKSLLRGFICKKIKSRMDYIPRICMQRILTCLPENTIEELPYGSLVLKYYKNNKIRWDIITSIEKISDSMELYDLTVPEYDTFMLANQLIAFDTMQVHVPILPKAVAEAKMMTLPNILFVDKTKQLIAAPELETKYGIYKGVNTKGSGKVKTFSSYDEVKNAYRRGEIGLNDIVEVK